MLRALERAEAAAPAASAGAPAASPYPGRLALLGIRRPRAALYRRINDRARALFAGGLLDEVAALQASGVSAESAPMSGHGYGEAIRVLSGAWSLEQAIEATARRTRQYAKRQLTWFRKEAAYSWFRADDPDAVNKIESRLCANRKE